MTDKGSGIAVSGSGGARCRGGLLAAGGAQLRGGANSPETRASQGPPQRRGTLRGALARPEPDLRVLDRLRAVEGRILRRTLPGLLPTKKNGLT